MVYACFLLATVAATQPASPPAATFAELPGQAELGYIEVRGVAAGPFTPAYWENRTLNLLPDLRAPLIEPRYSGPFRNIYAPSAVRLPEGWRVFYGAWDGVATPNDQIYSVTTPDFLDFGARQTVIAHGEFVHVCNVNAFRNPDGRFEMMCTVYPDANGQNKPGYFSSPDGETWNGAPAPYTATKADIAVIQGYKSYDVADINGTNVLLRDDSALHLYFNDVHNPGHVYRATGTDGTTYTWEAPVLETQNAVNDVKKFSGPRGTWYLMGLHRNTTSLWYSLSEDPLAFHDEKFLFRNMGPHDQYIVSMGWVCDGDRLLGVLYGAGAAPELNRNRIFAWWLQKRVVFVVSDKTRFAPEKAIGPDRQILRQRPGAPLDGHFEVYAEDGRSLIGVSGPMTLKPNSIYELKGIAPAEGS